MKQGDFVVHVVDPDAAIGEGLSALLETYGIKVQSYADAETFLESWPTRSTDKCCLLVEADLPGISGPALLQQILDECADLPVMLLISSSSPEMIAVARSSSRIGVIEKPIVNGTLTNRVLQLRQQA